MEDKSFILNDNDRIKNAKDDLLFNMSHDLRTPMNGVIGYIEMALKHREDSLKVSEYLTKSLMSAEYVLKIIDNTLSFSMVSDGIFEIKEEEVDIVKILHEFLEMISFDAERKGITLIAKNKINDRFLMLDRSYLLQVLLNIASNAINYTNRNGTVEISTVQKKCKDPGFVAFDFIISDNGIGMSKEFVEHIFEPFSKERSSTESGVKGIGIGMPLVKRIVEAMNGEISVESETNVGTKVSVSLRFKKSEQGEREENIVEHLIKDMRVLLVEDNDFNREITREILEDEGCIVDEANDGAMAIERLVMSQPGYYQAILMDIQMPYIDGYKATAMIRKMDDKVKSSIPIIALTANTFEEDRHRSMLAGMNDHLSKPIDIEKLLDCLSRYNTFS